MYEPLNQLNSLYLVHNYSKTYPDKVRLFNYAKPYLKKKQNLETHRNIDPYWQIRPIKLDRTVEKYKLLVKAPHNILAPFQLNHPHNPKREPIPMNPDSVKRSLNRTRTKIADLIACNDFEWFGTFTFGHKWCPNPCPKTKDECKRFDDDFVRKKLAQFLNHEQRDTGKFPYLIVPERHKSGALHFHGLFKGYQGELKNSGVLDPTGRQVYNMTRFNGIGFSNFSRIENVKATANYCRKYITKTLAEEKNRRRYWHSKGLKTPTMTYNINPLDILSKPHTVVTLQAESDTYSIYDIHTAPYSHTGSAATSRPPTFPFVL